MIQTFWLLLILVGASNAVAQSSFYQGKTITVVAGANAGSTYDLYVRLITAYMGKYIPGNPNFIVQNMGGAGSVVGANYVYNVSKPDGLAIGAIQPAIYFHQLLKQKEIRFDWAKFTWIGSTDKTDQMLYMRADLGYKSLADVRKAKELPRCGATAAGTSGVYILKLLEETLGARFNIISGYQGVREIDLGVERGELHCRAMTTAAYLSREPYHTWRKTGFTRVLVQTGTTRDPNFADMPTIYELMNEHKTAEKDRQLLTMILAATDFGRPDCRPAGRGCGQDQNLARGVYQIDARSRAAGRREKAKSRHHTEQWRRAGDFSETSHLVAKPRGYRARQEIAWRVERGRRQRK